MRVSPSLLEINCTPIISTCHLRGWLQWRDTQTGNRVLPWNSIMPPWTVNQSDCGELNECCCRDNHITHVAPTITGAPWYDPLRPESGRAFGFFIRNATLDRIDLDGTQNDLWELRVQLHAIANDPQALAYLLRWLDTVTSPSSCDQAHPSLAFFETCPPEPETGFWADNGWRTMHDIQRVSFKRVDEKTLDCGQVTEIIWRGHTVSKRVIDGEWCCFEGDPVPAEMCGRTFITPKCVNEGWLPSLPLNQTEFGYNDPASTYPTRFTGIYDTPAFESVAVMFEIDNPSDYPARNMRIEMFVDGNEKDPGCPRTLEEMLTAVACWTGLISEIPAQSKLRVDPYDRTVYVQCGGQWIESRSIVYGESGGPLTSYPIIDAKSCARRVCAAFTASSDLDQFGRAATSCEVRVRISYGSIL